MNRFLVMVAVGCATAAGLLWPHEASPHNPITTTVLFNREVAKIFQQKCTQCHHAEGLAMALTTYDEARPWAVAIKEEILDRRMPPWPAESGYGEFTNNLGLTGRERDFLISWIDGGAPAGDVEPPPFIDHSAHWMLGNPDVLLTARSGARIEPGRTTGFTRIVVDTGLTQEKWLGGFDYKPGDTRVVRAAFLTIVDTGQYLGAWTPWRSSMQTPIDVAFRLPARSRIAIDVFYQSSPAVVVDTPRLGLYFAARRPAREMSTTILESQPVSPAPAAPSAPRVTATLTLPRDTAMFELRPVMSAGGRSIEVKVKRPDGSSQVLLWIKKFRQEWPTSYVFRQPLTLPRGSIVQAVAYFDPARSQAAPQFTLTFSGYEALREAATAASLQHLPTTGQ